jgi:hypothetical protein
MSACSLLGGLFAAAALVAACAEGDIIVKPAPSPQASCLDRPNELPRPPTGGLPCDLIPPGWAP